MSRNSDATTGCHRRPRKRDHQEPGASRPSARTAHDRPAIPRPRQIPHLAQRVAQVHIREPHNPHRGHLDDRDRGGRPNRPNHAQPPGPAADRSRARIRDHPVVFVFSPAKSPPRADPQRSREGKLHHWQIAGRHGSEATDRDRLKIRPVRGMTGRVLRTNASIGISDYRLATHKPHQFRCR